MCRYSFPLANVDRHVGESRVFNPPRKITSTTKISRKYWLKDKTPVVPVSQNGNVSSDRFASAKNSGFNKKRRQCGGKYGWNGYILWAFFLQNFLLICATNGASEANLCAHGIRTPGRTWPKGDIILEHGQPLRIYCILNDNLAYTKFDGKNASDLVFYRGDTLIESKYLSVINETTLMLHVDKPDPSNDAYFCRLRLNDNHYSSRGYEAVCLNMVTIGFKPLEPLNFSCMSYNWQKLVCTWNPVPNYIQTRYSLAFKLPGRAGRSMLLFRCPLNGPTKDPPNTCIWDLSTHPHYRQAYEYYTFVLTAENVLGSNQFSYEFHHWEHVIPAQPDNLSIVNKTSSSALVYWKVPWVMTNFLPGLHHRVSYRNQRDSHEEWQTIDINDQKFSSEIYFNLTDLQYANVNYIVRVSLRSSLAVGEDKWSQFSEVIFKTAAALPGIPPRTDVGSFEVTGNDDFRDVYVYWQTIPQYLENGENFTYQVVHIEEENSGSLNLQPQEITKIYAKFEGVSLNSLKFDIVAINCKGPSDHKATVHVPRQLEMPQKPVVFTKIAFDGGIYELSWDSPNNPDIVNYTIFSCENDRDRPYQCSGYLDWVHVPQNTRIYNMTVPDPKKVYQFAIAANTAEASSGMAWASSMTTFSNVVGKLKSVWITRIESDLIQVGWSLEYCGRMGIVESYNIHYCPIVSAKNLTCDGPKMIATVMSTSHTLHGDLRNLKPYTMYSITVAVETKDGEGLHSDAIYVTTPKTSSDPELQSPKIIDIPLQPVKVLSDVSVSAEIEPRSSIVENILDGEITEHCDGDVDCRLDRISATRSNSIDCIGQVTHLTQAISTCEKNLNSLINENRELRDSLLQCNEIW